MEFPVFYVVFYNACNYIGFKAKRSPGPPVNNTENKSHILQSRITNAWAGISEVVQVWSLEL